MHVISRKALRKFARKHPDNQVALDSWFHILEKNRFDSFNELLDTLGILIRAYEETHYPAPEAKGKEMLHFLMEEHNLSPSQFPELGTEEVVAELIAGRRDLSIENIRALSKRFGISPATVI